MPISFRVRATRIAISPRLAIRTFWNTAAQSIYACDGREGRVWLPGKPYGRQARSARNRSAPKAPHGARPGLLLSGEGLRRRQALRCNSFSDFMLIELQSHSTV